MDEYNDLFEDCETHLIYVEFQFDEWPLLATLDQASQRQLCTEISAALEATKCPVQAIKVTPEALHLVAEVCVDLSIDGVAGIVETAAQHLMADGQESQGPNSYSASSLGPADVVEAVLRLR